MTKRTRRLDKYDMATDVHQITDCDFDSSHSDPKSGLPDHMRRVPRSTPRPAPCAAVPGSRISVH